MVLGLTTVQFLKCNLFILFFYSFCITQLHTQHPSHTLTLTQSHPHPYQPPTPAPCPSQTHLPVLKSNQCVCVSESRFDHPANPPPFFESVNTSFPEAPGTCMFSPNTASCFETKSSNKVTIFLFFKKYVNEWTRVLCSWWLGWALRDVGSF